MDRAGQPMSFPDERVLADGEAPDDDPYGTGDRMERGPDAKPGTDDPPSDPPPTEDEPEPQTWNRVPEGDDGLMGLVDHLEELRGRILTSLATLLLAACLCYAFSEQILHFLTSACPQQTFVFLDPAEAFFTHLKVSFYAGLILAAPVVVHQAWQFLRPALTVRERFATQVLFPVIVVFFGVGVAFAFFGILPLGLDFLLAFATPDLQPMLSISSYATFVLWFLLVFGLAFELPVLLFFANRVGLVSAALLRQHRPHIVVGMVIASALLTPPDVVSQLMLALPIWLLFEATLVLIGFFPGR